MKMTIVDQFCDPPCNLIINIAAEMIDTVEIVFL